MRLRTVVALADIKAKEHDYDALTRGIERFLPPRFMTVNTALRQLREIEEKRGEGGAFSCCSHDMQWLWLACDGIQHHCCVPFPTLVQCWAPIRDTWGWLVWARRRRKSCRVHWKSW